MSVSGPLPNLENVCFVYTKPLFHKCHQSVTNNEIDPKSDPFGPYFGADSSEIASNGV